jgi:hypothetical protein
LKAVLDGYLDTTVYGQDAFLRTNLAAVCADNDPGLWALPVWTATGILAACALPTNYLDATPFRCLSGLGVYTDGIDFVTTGRAYGWSNAQTIAGGSVPTNRQAWRTTDYGWSGVTSIVARLTHTITSDNGGRGYWATTNGELNVRTGNTPYPETDATYIGAQDTAEAVFATNNYATTDYEEENFHELVAPRAQCEAYSVDDDGPYGAAMMARYERLRVDGIYYTNTPAWTMDMYLYNAAGDSWIVTNDVAWWLIGYSPQGFGDVIGSNTWTVIEEAVERWPKTNATLFVYSEPVGPTTDVVLTWPTEDPGPMGDPHDITAGWHMFASDLDRDDSRRQAWDGGRINNLVLIVQDWVSTTNGFRYR